MPDCENKPYETPNTLSPLVQAGFFVKGVGLVQSCPMHSSHILATYRCSSYHLITFFFERPELVNKGFVKNPWPVPHQCSPSYLALKVCFSFPDCGAPCSVCGFGVLCAAAGEQPWVTGAPAFLRHHPEQVRACVGVLPSIRLPGTLQFPCKQLMVPKDKKRMWHL